MFYLTKRVDEKQCTVGERCMVLADFSGIPAGTKGIVSEIYSEGVTVAWEIHNCSLMQIAEAIKEDRCFPARGFYADGFSRDEMEYLAFETPKHPKVDAKVSNINH
jgi:hypothetical protein